MGSFDPSLELVTYKIEVLPPPQKKEHIAGGNRSRMNTCNSFSAALSSHNINNETYEKVESLRLLQIAAEWRNYYLLLY